MPKSSRRVPKYRHYKPKNLAVVRIDGHDHYLGKYDSPESKEEYHRLIAEWLAKENNPAPRPPQTQKNQADQASLTVVEVLAAYARYAKSYYSKDGKPTKEFVCMKEAIAPVRKLYGRTLAIEFGPKALKNVRSHMIQSQGLCRNEVNKRIGRIKRVLKWAVAEELVPPSVHHGLQAVAGLRYGRTEARESEPVDPAPDKDVDGVLPYVPRRSPP